MHNIQHMPKATRRAFEHLKRYLEPTLREQCASRDADLFMLRLGRYFNDLYEPLSLVYGDRPDFQQHMEALGDIMVKNYVERSEELRLMDIEHHMTPDWFQHETMLGYMCYVDRFAGTLQGILQYIDYLRELGVNYLHLLSVLQTRPGQNDGGYAIQDYRSVDPRIGTMEDLEILETELRDRDIYLCVDIVMNHTAQEHEWAQRALAGDPTYLDYYLTFEDRVLPDQYEQTLPEVFPDFAPGNFTWVPEMGENGRWVWTTFNSYQWDLNYRNPAVFCEMADIMMFVANKGVDVLRLDAIPFIWKNLGTDCQNQPEAHLLLAAFRAVARIVAPTVIFKAEAIVPPYKLIAYLGEGPSIGKRCELAYHNQLMVLLWSTMATRQVALLTHSLHQMPATPPGTTWLTYIRCHDDIGWAITDENAAAVGENGHLHRQFLNNFYSGNFPGSFAKGALFQYNPVTGDARISGMTASLVGLEQGIESGNLYRLSMGMRRILLMYSVIMAFGGIPIIYMGDELGQINDWSFQEDPAMAGDTRWMHRPLMDWANAAQRQDPRSMTGYLYAGLRKLVEARASTPAIHGAAATHPMWTDNPHVFALLRQRAYGNLLLLANFHEHTQSVSADLIGHAGLNLREEVRDALDHDGRPLIQDGRIFLEPYESKWLVDRSF